MSPPRELDPVFRAVRDHLAREAATVDAQAMLARLRSDTPAPSVPLTTAPKQTRRFVWAAGVTIAAVAASIALTLWFMHPQSTNELAAKESPEQLLRQAHATHSLSADRCYAVTAEWDPTAVDQARLGPLARTAKVWTRGDQFWVETTAPDGRTVAWGQTREGKIWIAPTPRFGLVYEPAEVAEPILRYCDLMSLRLVTTLGEVLEQFDLFRRDSGLPGEPVRIDATLRSLGRNPMPRFRRVEMELDPETKGIRTAVLTRQWNGEPVGRLTFTLVDTTTQPDRAYELRGHLDEDGKVFEGRAQPKLPGGPAPFRPDPRAKARDEFLKRMQSQPK